MDMYSKIIFFVAFWLLSSTHVQCDDANADGRDIDWMQIVDTTLRSKRNFRFDGETLENLVAYIDRVIIENAGISMEAKGVGKQIAASWRSRVIPSPARVHVDGKWLVVGDVFCDVLRKHKLWAIATSSGFIVIPDEVKWDPRVYRVWRDRIVVPISKPTHK